MTMMMTMMITMTMSMPTTMATTKMMKMIRIPYAPGKRVHGVTAAPFSQWYTSFQNITVQISNYPYNHLTNTLVSDLGNKSYRLISHSLFVLYVHKFS